MYASSFSSYYITKNKETACVLLISFNTNVLNYKANKHFTANYAFPTQTFGY